MFILIVLFLPHQSSQYQKPQQHQQKTIWGPPKFLKFWAKRDSANSRPKPDQICNPFHPSKPTKPGNREMSNKNVQAEIEKSQVAFWFVEILPDTIHTHALLVHGTGYFIAVFRMPMKMFVRSFTILRQV